MLNCENYGQVRGNNRKVAKNLQNLETMLNEMYQSKCFDEHGRNVAGGTRGVFGVLDEQLEKIKLSAVASVSRIFTFIF